MPLVQIEGLGVAKGASILLDAVDLSVAPRSIHALIGRNGAGKSTLIAALLGQVDFSGRIRLHWRGSGRIGLVPQSFAADRTLPITVGEFLALPRQARPVCFGVGAGTRRRIEALLGRVGLPGCATRRLGVLSGGELRRVLLANAIDPVPELLLCDEPASGVDPASVARLDELLAELREREGTTILLVSHDHEQVRRLADRVTLLDRRAIATGSAATVLANAGAVARAP